MYEQNNLPKVYEQNTTCQTNAKCAGRLQFAFWFSLACQKFSFSNSQWSLWVERGDHSFDLSWPLDMHIDDIHSLITVITHVWTIYYPRSLILRQRVLTIQDLCSMSRLSVSRQRTLNRQQATESTETSKISANTFMWDMHYVTC